MFKNNFKIALRNITGNWLYAGINIVGLGIGLACCLLMIPAPFSSSHCNRKN